MGCLVWVRLVAVINIVRVFYRTDGKDCPYRRYPGSPKRCHGSKFVSHNTNRSRIAK